LNPPLGFYFPLFSMSFAREFPSGWKSAERSRSKIVVFLYSDYLQSFHVFLTYCDFHHGDLKNPSIMRFALWGLKTLGAPLANPLTSGGAVRIDLSPRGSVLVLRLRITAVPC
jgi:hypothetical protein